MDGQNKCGKNGNVAESFIQVSNAFNGIAFVVFSEKCYQLWNACGKINLEYSFRFYVRIKHREE